MNIYNYKRTVFYIICSVVIFLGVFLYNNHAIAYKNIQEKMSAWKLVPVPETFTELYFEDHASLPKQTKANETSIFSFTIHNMEGTTKTYPYEVYFEYASSLGKVTFVNDTVTLAPGEYKTITVSHTWLSSRLQGKVIVKLITEDQYIAFLLPNTN